MCHGPQFTVAAAAAATTKPEVGVEHQKCVKLQVFRLWTLQFFEIFFDILQETSEHHGPPFIITAVSTTKPKMGVEHQKSVKMQVFVPGLYNFF